MNKFNKKYLLIIIILLVILVVITFLYIKMKNTTKELNFIQEKDNISTINNMTMNNLNIIVSENNILPNETLQERDYTIDFNKIKIEVDINTITRNSVYATIINNNENEILYNVSFKIQKNIDGEWKDLEYLPNIAWNLIYSITKGNSQTRTKLDIKTYYGELDKGNYRVVKEISNGNGKIANIYSNEFKID